MDRALRKGQGFDRQEICGRWLSRPKDAWGRKVLSRAALGRNVLMSRLPFPDAGNLFQGLHI